MFSSISNPQYWYISYTMIVMIAQYHIKTLFSLVQTAPERKPFQWVYKEIQYFSCCEPHRLSVQHSWWHSPASIQVGNNIPFNLNNDSVFSGHSQNYKYSLELFSKILRKRPSWCSRVSRSRFQLQPGWDKSSFSWPSAVSRPADGVLSKRKIKVEQWS